VQTAEVKTEGLAVRHATVSLILVLLAFAAFTWAEDSKGERLIPNCAATNVEGKRVRTGRLSYVVPKHAIVKQIKDIDYREYRVLRSEQGKWEGLTIFLGDGSPYSICSAARHQTLRLSDGRKGVDARCSSSTNGGNEASRSTGFMNEYAYYDSVSAESAKYFDSIIDSMCYEPQRK
jgi:hypothetical protein